MAYKKLHPVVWPADASRSRDLPVGGCVYLPTVCCSPMADVAVPSFPSLVAREVRHVRRRGDESFRLNARRLSCTNCLTVFPYRA